MIPVDAQDTAPRSGAANVDVAGANASANRVIAAIGGLSAILARIETAVKNIQVERTKAVDIIHKERDTTLRRIDAAVKNIHSEQIKAIASINSARDAAIAAVRAAAPPPSSGSASQESKNRNIEGRTYRETGR